MTDPDNETMIDECREVMAEVCTDWECNFLDDLYHRLSDGVSTLTERQEEILIGIYGKVCRSSH